MAYACRRDPNKVREALTNAVREAAREWAEKGRGTHQQWRQFLKQKITAAVRSIPVECTFGR